DRQGGPGVGRPARTRAVRRNAVSLGTVRPAKGGHRLPGEDDPRHRPKARPTPGQAGPLAAAVPRTRGAAPERPDGLGERSVVPEDERAQPGHREASGVIPETSQGGAVGEALGEPAIKPADRTDGDISGSCRVLLAGE